MESDTSPTASAPWGLTGPPSSPPGSPVTLKYHQPEPDLFVIEGTLDGRAIQVRLRHVDPSQFLLLNRGFHWINELPYNAAVPRGTGK